MTAWRDTAKAEVGTPAGMLQLVVHGPISEYSDRRTRSAVGMTVGGQSEYPYAVINGVRYSLTVSLEQSEDGSWSLARDEHGRDYQAISGMRESWSSYNDAHLTDAAKRFVRDKVAPVLIAYLGDHPELIREADQATAAQAAHGLERKITEMRTELAALDGKLAEALRLAAGEAAGAMNPDETRIRELEAEGMSRSDAQAVAMAELVAP